jgi:hypothetical protein
MTNPTIKIHNVETDEVIEREMNAEEFARYEANQAAEAERANAEAQKTAARQALLDRLGITAEEAQLLLGSN